MVATLMSEAPAVTRTATGFAFGTLITTLRGDVPVEELCAGDRVITRQGARPIKAMQVVDLKSVLPCRITCNALGNARPDADITVAPDQPILLRDWRATALFGQSHAMVPAHRLVDGNYIARDTVPVDLSVIVMDLGESHVIYANGLEFGVCAD